MAMNRRLARDIADARQELGVAITRMRAAIELCERLHERVGGVASEDDIDQLMRQGFREDPVGYTLMAVVQIVDEVEEEGGGWKQAYLSALLFAADRIETLAEFLSAAGIVSKAAVEESAETVAQLMALIRSPKGRAN